MNPDSSRPTSDTGPQYANRINPLRTAERRRTDSWNLRFVSAGTRIPATTVAKSATLQFVAAEEVCWQIAMNSLRAERPWRWRRRARAAWTKRLRALEEQRDWLGQLVDEELKAR